MAMIANATQLILCAQLKSLRNANTLYTGKGMHKEQDAYEDHS